MNIINDRTSDHRMCAGVGIYQEMHGRGCELGGNGGNSGGSGLGYGSGDGHSDHFLCEPGPGDKLTELFMGKSEANGRGDQFGNME